ncbi:hypothetical protein [Roseivivax sp. CAU 1761]
MQQPPARQQRHQAETVVMAARHQIGLPVDLDRLQHRDPGKAGRAVVVEMVDHPQPGPRHVAQHRQGGAAGRGGLQVVRARHAQRLEIGRTVQVDPLMRPQPTHRAEIAPRREQAMRQHVAARQDRHHAQPAGLRQNGNVEDLARRGRAEIRRDRPEHAALAGPDRQPGHLPRRGHKEVARHRQRGEGLRRPALEPQPAAARQVLPARAEILEIAAMAP